MTFVNELISDTDKAKIDWTKFKYIEWGNPHRPWKWTIDHNRDAFLVLMDAIGRDDTGTRPEVFVLSWEGKTIRLEARAAGSGSGKFWEEMTWTISKVGLPRDLRSRETEVLSLISDALRAHGHLYNSQHLKDVKVRFDV